MLAINTKCCIKIKHTALFKTTTLLCSLNFHILLQEYQFVHIFCQEARPTCSDYVPCRWENTFTWHRCTLDSEVTLGQLSNVRILMLIVLPPYEWVFIHRDADCGLVWGDLFMNDIWQRLCASFLCCKKICKYHCHGRFFSGEERSLMALAPLLKMNWPLGLHCFYPVEYMTK